MMSTLLTTLKFSWKLRIIERGALEYILKIAQERSKDQKNT